MAKSRKRKDHNKKVASRNSKIKAQQMAVQKIMNEAMAKEMEALKQQYEESQSGQTEIVTTDSQ